MQQVEGSVWIKGWFDGDFIALEETHADLRKDVTSSRQLIIRGRMSAVQRIDEIPRFPDDHPPLYQRLVEKVHLDSGDGRGWITQVYDLHIPDWNSYHGDGLVSESKSGGRLVGWAFAKLIPHRPLQIDTKKEESLLTLAPLVADSQVTGNSQGLRSGNLFENSTATDTAVNCDVCKLRWPLLVGLLVWIVCSWKWAIWAVLPLLLRCLVSKKNLPILKENLQWLASLIIALIGVLSFASWWTFGSLDCHEVPIWPIIILALMVVASSRLVHCWIPFLLAMLWAIVMLLSCPEGGLRCLKPEQWWSGAIKKTESAKIEVERTFKPDRDAQEIVAQTSQPYPWKLVTLDQAERESDKIFNCNSMVKQEAPYAIALGHSALFELNRSDLSEKAEASLVKLGQLLQSYPETSILVVGHSDSAQHPEGSIGNLRLSEERSQKVAQWLIDKGYLQYGKVTSMGLGERFPVINTYGESRLNRRVEIRVQCKLGTGR